MPWVGSSFVFEAAADQNKLVCKPQPKCHPRGHLLLPSIAPPILLWVPGSGYHACELPDLCLSHQDILCRACGFTRAEPTLGGQESG